MSLSSPNYSRHGNSRNADHCRTKSYQKDVIALEQYMQYINTKFWICDKQITDEHNALSKIVHIDIKHKGLL